MAALYHWMPALMQRKRTIPIDCNTFIFRISRPIGATMATSKSIWSVILICTWLIEFPSITLGRKLFPLSVGGGRLFWFIISTASTTVWTLSLLHSPGCSSGRDWGNANDDKMPFKSNSKCMEDVNALLGQTSSCLTSSHRPRCGCCCWFSGWLQKEKKLSQLQIRTETMIRVAVQQKWPTATLPPNCINKRI